VGGYAGDVAGVPPEGRLALPELPEG